ncbi:hypothetical protein Ddye_014381 [Dipteronia dyeriana]|uniref:Neprosin PEP catalytic domain-containing protein n=1 Tax=Dipteronia dyeriana TaxID=168575 RepID=A0AAD9X7X1_9ROSI|nr:hypothetical protein Ddye_014381 [Dipteronia dyeriana]
MVGGDYKIKFTFSLFAIIVVCTHCKFVHGRRLAIRTNKDMIMHEGTVKTIESDDGDVIDCVEINKQPALNHPLLRNHSIQMKPNFQSSGLSANNKNQVIYQSWHKNGECPKGTIPIVRTQNFSCPPPSQPPITQANHAFENQAPPLFEYAYANLTRENFVGTQAYFNVWHPQTLNDECSKAQIWMLGGFDRDLNAIEIGWMVSGDDDRTRLFIYWTSDGYQKTGCYNLQCPGFVQIDDVLALGGSVEPVSIYKGQQREIQFIVKKDQITQNWWLKVGDRIIGYWPHPIMTGLYYCSTEIKWGGAVLNKNVGNHHTATQMGSGHFPEEGFGKASLIRNLGFYNESYNLITNFKGLYFGPVATRPSCYDVILEDHGDAYGTHLYFGGSGFSMDCL